MSVEDGATEESSSPTTTQDPPVESSEVASLPATLQERFLRVKNLVKQAIESHRTFMIYGKSRVIRESMLARGWCEKLYMGSGQRSNERTDEPAASGLRPGGKQLEASPVSLLAGIGDLKEPRSERLLISRMLADVRVDFLWNSGSEWAGWPSRDNRTTIFNRYCRAAFTSKIGLCSNVGQMHWYYEADVAEVLFPRCYNVSQCDQMTAFVQDFRFTACLSLLKWLIEKTEVEGEPMKANNAGVNPTTTTTTTVPLKQALEFAIARCTEYIGGRSHEDVDRDVERVWSHQWDQFIRSYYKIVRDSESDDAIRNDSATLQKYCLASRHVLKKMRKYWQQLDMDGTMNIWILKPGNKSRGRGIILVDKLEDVTSRIDPANKSDARYVVQKYIERPMLIYRTKFDIRQWFIVTCAQPLTLWMYRESYLRFCSENFRLEDFHESIHLCNNAVQCKYENSPDRDPALPTDNMWDSTTLKEYLKERGQGNAWDELIYPGMRRSLVGSLLASQEAMDRRKNSFELYGADFMLMEDFSVWLIEINSHPDMSYSSSVTTRLCKSVMEDTIKVVIDLRENKNADTGLFELAYKQKMPNNWQPYPAVALSLQGTRITTIREKPPSRDQVGPPTPSLVKSPVVTLGRNAKTATRGYIGPVIVDLIEELELRLDQEFVTRCRLDAVPSARNRRVGVGSAPVERSSKNSFHSVESIAGTSPTEEKDGSRNGSLKSATSRLNAHARSAKPQKSSPKVPEKETKQVIDTAMRNAATRYKKYGMGPDAAASHNNNNNNNNNLPSTTTKNEAASRRGTSTRKRRRRRVKTKVSEQRVDGMYAVGSALAK